MTPHNRAHGKQRATAQLRTKGHEPKAIAELTAQPKSLPEELNEFARDNEEGLSIDSDDLGSQFLEDAVEQGDETNLRMEGSGLSLTGAPESDQAFAGPNFEANQDVWENTINLALQEGTEDALEALAPASSAVEIEMADIDEEGEFLEEPETELDLTQSVVREGSLFDHEVGETGEVESPRLETDDTHKHRRFQISSPRGRGSAKNA